MIPSWCLEARLDPNMATIVKEIIRVSQERMVF